jgi:hypothetical protein
MVGCGHCKQWNEAANIRIEPTIEYCGKMCNVLKDKQCAGYYEDLDIDCNKDKIYSDWKKCKLNKGVVKMTCTEFCEYEMSNSVQLNPKCIAETLVNCSEVEHICK